jgi:Tol biopolymer transport system component
MRGRLVVVGLVSVLALGLWPGTAGAAFSGTNGKITYTGGEIRHSIWSVNPDGTGNVQLTQDGSNGSSYLPSWSRLGTRIAFSSVPSVFPVPRWEVYAMNPDGSARTLLSRLAEAGLVLLDKPSWSPDGQKLAIAAHPRNEEFGLCVRDYIWDFFDRQACNVGVYTMNADGTGLTRLRDGFQPAWSPRGDRIAFSAYLGTTTEIFTMRPDGSGVALHTYNEFRDEEPSWSPDGSKLAFTSDRVQRLAHPSWDQRCCSGGPGDIFTMDADGTNVRQVTTSEGLDAGPAWSPEGDEIAFASTRRTPDCDPNPSVGFHCQSDIYVMRVDGANVRPVAFFGHAPDWQPTSNFPPECWRVSASPAVVESSNHRLVTITLSDLPPDPDGDTATVSITGVTQDEPVNGTADAVSGPAPNQVRVRAERDGAGDGRVYRVAFEATDGRGGICTGTVKIAVPKGGGLAIDSAPPSYDSFGS